MLKTMETAEKEVVSLYLGHAEVEILFTWFGYMSLKQKAASGKALRVVSLSNKPWT